MSLTKCGVRTIRRACSGCGSYELYAAHDSEGPADGQWCDEHGSANRTLIERDGSKHVCPGNNGEPVATPVAVPVITPKPAAPVAAPTATPVANDAKFAQLASLLGELTTATVDVAQVHSIVDERLRGLVLPMRVEVTRNGETKPVEGLAHKMLPAVIKILSVRKHVMMVGPAGTGKSHIGHQAADALGLPFYAISVGPTMTESRIIGYKDATGNYQATLFREAYENGGVFLFDEVDNGSASVLIVINAALANGMMAFPDGMVKRHPDFVVIAAANTYGIGPDRAYVGRQALDAAFRNRFIYVPIGVDEPLEEALCMGTGLDTGRVKSVLAYCRHLRRNVERNKLPVVVGPRNSESACTLLAAGFMARETIEYAIRCGMSDTDWSKVADGAPSI